MKKILALCLAAAMLFALGAGCQQTPTTPTGSSPSPAQQDTARPSPDPTAADDLTIKWFHHWGEEGLRVYADWVGNKVTENYPNITVEIEVVSADKYQQLLKTKIASDDAPAMFDLTNRIQLQEFVDSGYLLDLTGQPFLDDIRESVIKGGTLADGHVYAAHVSVLAYGLWYNKNVFDTVGITEIPETWDSYISTLQKIRDAGIAPIAGGFQEAWTLSTMFSSINRSHALTDDPEFYSKAVSGEKKFADNPVFIRSLEQLAELMKYMNDDPFGSDANKQYELVGTSNAAMLFQGSWCVEAIKSKDPNVVVGLMGIPRDDNPDHAMMDWGADGGFCVYNFEDQAMTDAGLKLLETLLSVEGSSIFMEKAIQISCVESADMSFENAFVDLQNLVDAGRVFSFSGLGVSYTPELDVVFSEELVKYAMEAHQGSVDPAAAAAAFDTAFDASRP